MILARETYSISKSYAHTYHARCCSILNSISWDERHVQNYDSTFWGRFVNDTELSEKKAFQSSTLKLSRELFDFRRHSVLSPLRFYQKLIL